MFKRFKSVHYTYSYSKWSFWSFCDHLKVPNLYENDLTDLENITLKYFDGFHISLD